MSRLRFLLISILAINFFFGIAHAQNEYTYTLIDNGNYNFTIGAVPNTSSSNFATSVQSYGFTIILPDGVTATLTSSLGSGASATFFDGNNVGDPTIDGYLITETLGSPVALAVPSSGTISPMVTLQINEMPTSGTLYILDNNSALATAVTPLKSFLQADMEDDGMAMYSNRVDPNGSGTSGMSSFNFATLSTTDVLLSKLTVYPNPVATTLHIKGNTNSIQKIEICNSSGVVVLSIKDGFQTIDVDRFSSGMYLLTLYSEKSVKTIKFIKG